MHRDTVTRSWGTLSCHSSAAITSCFSMIMHGPMSRICIQYLEAENAEVLPWPAYSPDMSPREHLGDAQTRRVWQRVPVPANIQQLRIAIEEEWGQHSSGHNQQPDQLCEGDVTLHKANGGHTRYWLVFWSTPFPFFKVSVTNSCISVFPVMWNQ